MYTRCPECRNAFRVTVAQLTAADGLVRCGRCDSVFRADTHLFAPAGAGAAERVPETPTDAAGEQSRAQPRRERAAADIPVVSDASIFHAPRRGPPAAVWGLGALVAAALLAAQFAYFYRHELARVRELQPALEKFCEVLRCDLPLPAYAVVPELIETEIAAHPRYANALRLRASFVNRTDRVQPLPRLQLSFTDSDGQLLTRRTFGPGEYVADAADAIEPDVVIHARLDVTNPDEKATGYEVKLFPPEAARAH